MSSFIKQELHVEYETISEISLRFKNLKSLNISLVTPRINQEST